MARKASKKAGKYFMKCHVCGNEWTDDADKSQCRKCGTVTRSFRVSQDVDLSVSPGAYRKLSDMAKAVIGVDNPSAFVEYIADGGTI